MVSRIRGVTGGGVSRIVDVVREETGVGIDHAFDGLGIRVEQELGRVAPQAAGGIVVAVDPIPVALPWLDAYKVDVPDESVAFGDVDAGFLVIVIEQAEFDFRRDGGEEGEIDARAIIGGAERIG